VRAYLVLLKGVYLTRIVYRLSFVFTLLGNLLYLALIYFLWRSIYRGTDKIHDLTFNQAFLYLAIAGALFNLFKTWTDWNISRTILNGSIAVDLIKPLDYQLQMLFQSAGMALANFTLITLPSLVVLFFVFRAELALSLGLLFFPLGLVFAFLISFVLDYLVGLTSFYTQSLWGISMTKEVIVSLLSGAMVPLHFFPATAQALLKFLPFQAIYHIPLLLIVSPQLSLGDCAGLLATQGFWVIALFMLSRFFYRRAVTVLTVNGG
jgi:ABC-2 type transport system permease protein